MVEVANIGLCGAHRVGKTTLANALSRVRSLRFVRTNTSGIFNEYKIDPAKPMAFPSRLSIQHRILDAAEEIWSKERSVFVTDRTPLDMAAYTLADVQGSTTVAFKELHNYLNMCFRITNRFFGTVILVQPGIPLVYQHGKAALNEAYIEHINSLILGLCHDERLHCKVLRLGREMISIEERVNAVVNYCTSTPIKY